MTKDSKPLEDAFDHAIAASDGEKVTVRALLDEFDDRSFGPIFTILGLLCVIPPIGAIPLLPSVIGFVMLLFSVQMVVGRNHVWLPGFVESFSISESKVRKASDVSRPALEFVDAQIAERLRWATAGPARYAAAVLVTLLALLLIPLELVPFAVAAPGIAITAVGVALTARDGLLMLIAYILSAIAFYILFKFVPMPGG